jgi:hypothetical protein
MSSKYIILEVDGMEVALVFSDLLVHADVANGAVKSQKDLGRIVRVTSAGFCELTPLVRCWGGSDSLCLVHSNGDAEVIGRAYGLPAMRGSSVIAFPGQVKPLEVV